MAKNFEKAIKELEKSEYENEYLDLAEEALKAKQLDSAKAIALLLEKNSDLGVFTTMDPKTGKSLPSYSFSLVKAAEILSNKAFGSPKGLEDEVRRLINKAADVVTTSSELAYIVEQIGVEYRGFENYLEPDWANQMIAMVKKKDKKLVPKAEKLMKL